MIESENEVIKKAQQGDMEAFSLLVKEYSCRVLTLTRRLLNNPEDAEDASQEVFLKVFKNIKGFRFESQFYTWVYRIVVNVCYNHRKKSSRYYYLEPEESEDLWERLPVESSGAVDSLLMNRSIQSRIDEALNTLSSQQRTVFILKFYEGQKIKDIAALLDLSEGTVKRYLFRATQKLRSCLYDLR